MEIKKIPSTMTIGQMKEILNEFSDDDEIFITAFYYNDMALAELSVRHDYDGTYDEELILWDKEDR